MKPLDLFGLIGDDVILYNRIIGTFYKNMTKIYNSGSTKCRVSINKITLKNSHNCYINIKNNCYVNSTLGLNILFNSIIDNLEFIDIDTKLRLEKNLGVTLSKDEDQRNKGFLKKCNISSETTNNIFIDSLTIKNCNSSSPLEFTFLNTGDSNANCGITSLLNALSKKDGYEVKEERINKVLGLNLTDYIYILIILFILALLFLLPLNRKVEGLLTYQYKTTL